MNKKERTECDRKGHDLYISHIEHGVLIYKCMYCPYTVPDKKKKEVIPAKE
jgi:hypothetical protein